MKPIQSSLANRTQTTSLSASKHNNLSRSIGSAIDMQLGRHKKSLSKTPILS